MKIRTPHGPSSPDVMVPNMHFVVLPLDGGPLSEPVLQGVTDSKGEATIQVPQQFIKKRPDGSYWANVILREDGKQSRRAVHLARTNSPWGRTSKLYRENLMSIEVFDGCTTFGQTVDSSDRPIATPVRFRDRQGNSLSQLPPKRRIIQYRNLNNGWHALHHAETTVIQASAEHPGIGTGSITSLQLNCEEERQPFKLMLMGEGVLQGTVVDQNRRPVAGVRMFFDKRGLKEDAFSSKPGIDSGSARSNREGRFRIDGIQPGSYGVQVYGEHLRTFTNSTLHDQRFQANGKDSLLSLKQTCLQVHVLSSSGERWKEELTIPSSGYFDRHKPTVNRYVFSPPGTPRIVVTEAGKASDAHLADFEDLVGVRIKNDLYSFQVRDGQEYWVGIIGGNFPMTFQKVKIDKDHDYTNIVLRAVESPDYGIVKVRPMTAHTSGTYKTASNNSRVWVETVPEGVCISKTQFRGDTVDMRLPVGHYRVVAQGTPDHWGYSNPSCLPRTLGFEDMLVDIKAGETLMAKPILKEGALLELTIAAQSEASACPFHDKMVGSFLLQGAPKEPHAKLHLEHAARRSVPVPHSAKAGNPHRSPTPYWLLNERTTSERLPYGDYTLVVTLCDGRVQRVPVQLKSKRTTKLTIQFVE
ncbi:MAG: carboxypeptidase regulatory-like domain-containing protein [bacterium]|nr:carboxypeptidase regulatory-like domain-containing protein [bacterium]